MLISDFPTGYVGDDVLAQTAGATTSYLQYDGHGSTRLLTSATSAIANRFDYDAYGKNLFSANVTNPASTDMLYSGEQFDPNLQMQYLRARYYDQNNGRFNRLDPFGGNHDDPQSLHKYGYAHSNPIMNIDPSGMMSLLNVMASAATITTILATTISGIVAGKNPVYATITGLAGGLSIGYLIISKKFKNIIKAFIAGALASVLSLILDSLTAVKNIASYVFDFFEAFSWSAFNSTIMLKSKKGLTEIEATFQADNLEYLAQNISKLFGDIFMGVHPNVASTLSTLRIFSDMIAHMVISLLGKGFESVLTYFLPSKSAKKIIKRIKKEGFSKLKINSPAFRAKVAYSVARFGLVLMKKHIGNKFSDWETDLKEFYHQY